MKAMRLMRAIGEIDDRYIEEAAPPDEVRSKALRVNLWVRYAAVAACAVLVLGIAVFAVLRTRDIGTTEMPGASSLPASTTAPAVPGVTASDTSVPLSAAPPTEDTADTTEALAMAGNPFEEFDTLAEACTAAGFDLNVPDTFGSFTERSFCTINREIIEVSYLDSSGSEGLCIRKGKGSDDISGDYGSYADTKVSEINGRTVTLQGNDGKFSKAVWTDGEFAYSAVTGENALSLQEFTELIEKIS